jgi:hypothetical protein
MPENPHEYTTRKKWASDEDFLWVVRFIRTYGYVEWFPDLERGWPYVALDLGGFHYWTMGGRQILINRKKL